MSLRTDRLDRLMRSFVIAGYEGQLVRFAPNYPQQLVQQKVWPLLDSGKPLNLIFLKARQEGVSTWSQLFTFAWMLAQPRGKALTIAHEAASSEHIFSMTKRIVENAEWGKQAEIQKREVILGPRSWEIATAGARYTGRGKTLRSLHISELAFWVDPEVLTGVLQTIPSPPIPTVTIIESTANGQEGPGELFHDLWEQAEAEADTAADIGGLFPIFLPWFILPAYDRQDLALTGDLHDEEKELRAKFGVRDTQLAWRRWAIKVKCHGDLNMFHQEYPAYPEEAFIASGTPAFDPRAIAKQRDFLRPPDTRYTLTADKTHLIPHTKGPLSLWAQDTEAGRLLPPLPGHRYVIGVDTAQGAGGNLGRTDPTGDEKRSWAAASLWDVDTMEQVGEWHEPSDGYRFAHALRAIGFDLFNEPLMNIELNFLGRFVQTLLMERWGYANFHLWRGKQDRIKPVKELVYGWETTTSSRGQLIGTAQEYLSTGRVTIHSELTLKQLASFSRIFGGLYDASLKDDLAFAAMLAWRSREETFGSHRPATVGGGIAWLESIGIRAQPDVEGQIARHIRHVFRGDPPWAKTAHEVVEEEDVTV